MPSLKYLFTELVCVLADGPETMSAPTVRDTHLGLAAKDFFKLLGCVQSSADHVDDPRLAHELAQALYDGMDLIVAKMPDWNLQVQVGPPEGGSMFSASKIPTKSHKVIAAEVKAISVQVGVPMFYVPMRKGGFLLSMDAGADGAIKDSAAHMQRVKETEALGFEAQDGAPGVATIGSMTDKDIYFLIDVSGSMRGGRITNATNNALKVFDTFTTDEDHVGLAWFHTNIDEKFGLKPKPMVSRSTIDSTRNAVKGMTAFFDAIIFACEKPPQSSNSYLVALTDGSDTRSTKAAEDAMAAIAESPWTVLIIGLQVDDVTRGVCEQLAGCSPGGMYIHAADAGKALDEAFAKVASQFVMPKVKSADAAAAGGGTRGV